MSILSKIFRHYNKPLSLDNFWQVTSIEDDGSILSKNRKGFMFEIDGLDGSFFLSEQLTQLHQKWRSAIQLSPNEELQIIFRKRVDFIDWIEKQLNQSFLSENTYGRQLLLDRLSDQVSQMSLDEPRLLTQKIIVCFWTKEPLQNKELQQKKHLFQSQLKSFGFGVQDLKKSDIYKNIHCSSQDLSASDIQEAEWPSVKIEAGQLHINDNIFRALELKKLPENLTQLGMIQSITGMPYPMDISVRLKARDIKPIISRLERKRNMLHAQRTNKGSASAFIDSQLDQIDKILRSLADQSECVFDMQLTVGLRFPKYLANFHRHALANIIRAGAQMDFCELEETTLSTFDSYMECIPSFSGRNIRNHTVLSSNAIHFLPFFRPAKGDPMPVASFQTRDASLYGIDPVDHRLANYNWLVSGTSGSGKSFFVNSLLGQSASINPNIFIIDIGGSYNKLTQFLGGRVMSLEPGQGFELSPFFTTCGLDQNEERMRQQHTLQIFLEMTRIDGQLPPIETRHLLSEQIEKIYSLTELPSHPISYLIESISQIQTPEARRLTMLLRPWSQHQFFGQFLDNNKILSQSEHILTFDLKGLTEFDDLARVVQLIVCSYLWAKIRQTEKQKFSWIVLDEVAFSLLKTQPQFVDELVSTLRKHFAGAVIVVQDLEKVTSNLAGSSILQNTQSKAILQQRGNPNNYAKALSLNELDIWAIESLEREKGRYSDIFLIRDNEKTIIRHVPSHLEYWLGTTAPEDSQTFTQSMESSKGNFQEKVIDLFSNRKEMTQ